jgi:hypothetical protein
MSRPTWVTHPQVNIERPLWGHRPETLALRSYRVHPSFSMSIAEEYKRRVSPAMKQSSPQESLTGSTPVHPPLRRLAPYPCCCLAHVMNDSTLLQSNSYLRRISHLRKRTISWALS